MRTYLVQLVSTFETLSKIIRENNIAEIREHTNSTILIEQENDEHFSRIVDFRTKADASFIFHQLTETLGVEVIVEWLQVEGHNIEMPKVQTRSEYHDVLKKIITIAATDSRVRDYLRAIPVYPTLEEGEE